MGRQHSPVSAATSDAATAERRYGLGSQFSVGRRIGTAAAKRFPAGYADGNESPAHHQLGGSHPRSQSATGRIGHCLGNTSR